MSHDHEDIIAQCRKNKWFEVEFSIEALGIAQDLVESTLKQHVEKLGHVKNVVVTVADFHDVIEVEKPIKNVEKAYSQIVMVKLYAKNLATLLHVVMLYGPSSIEVLGPESKTVEMGEVQDVSNSLAGLVHQFAAAGVGGIVITPEKK